MLKKQCEICKREFIVANNRPKARFCSIKCKAQWQKQLPEEIRKKISNTLKNKGIKPPSRWIENPTNYSTIHKWLIKEYGKADRCENKQCNGKSKNYQYALIKGFKYERKRENFIMLCVSCHKKYDMTLKTKKQIIKNLNWYKNGKRK